MKCTWIAVVLLSVAAEAAASTSTFYGTTGVDAIVVGRAYNYGLFGYVACINGVWEWGGAVTGSSDTVTVYGDAGSDTITVRDTNDIYPCGIIGKWLYRMDYSYVCPTIDVYGGDGGDRIYGAQCVEYIYGEAGADYIFSGGGNDYVSGGTENDCIEDTSLASLVCGSGTDRYTDDVAWKSCETPVAYCIM